MGNACTTGGAKRDNDERHLSHEKPGSAAAVLKQRGSSLVEEDDKVVHRRDVETDYELGRKLGEGAFGKVVLGKHRASGEEVAIKYLGIRALISSDVGVEISTMRRVSHHHNIVKLYDCYLQDAAFVMTLELCSGGELFDRIVAKHKYTEREARTAFAQMVEAIGHCHAHEVIHRDLKPENLLYAAPEGQPGGDVLKLADFGLAHIIQPEEHLKQICGSPGYVAPEIFTTRRGGRDAGYGKEVDLWTCGVILYILLCGYPPFWDPHGSERNVKRQIVEGRYDFPADDWKEISPEAVTLVKGLMTVDPAKRLSAEDVFGDCLSHEGAPVWMKKEHGLDMHIPHFCDNMKKYVLRTKFKGAVDAIMTANMLKHHSEQHLAEAKAAGAVAEAPAEVVAEENL